jgi:hypothetical protein
MPLLDIKMQQNRIADVSDIAEALKVNNTLEVLDLGTNFLQDMAPLSEVPNSLYYILGPLI